jgi:hypothetical protein
MKKLFITGLAMLMLQQLIAQNALDALRFSYLTPTGSARNQAIGGSNISLGGDISSAFINPAGLAQFKTNELVLSPGFFMNNAKLSYNDSLFKAKRNKLNVGASGLILSWGSPFKSSKIRNTTIALAVNQAANFNSNISYGGRNVNSSFSEKWVEELIYNDVRNIDDVLTNFPGGASQAYETYLIDTIAGFAGYRTNADVSKMPLNQTFNFQTRGAMHEVAASMAWNMREKILYGVTIGFPLINYRRQSTVTERDLSGNTNNDFESFTFTETFSTIGAGLNAKLGVIFKPVEYFRLGLTFHTPSVLTLTDRTNATLTSNIENRSRRLNNDNTKPTSYTYSTSDYTDGNDYTYNYQLITPWRLGASASYVFREIKDVTKQKAFITADVELVNYKASSYSSNQELPSAGEEAYFKSVNNNIDELYRMAINARIGGEVKFNTFMVRGGFAYMGSPYQKDVLPDGIKGWRMIPSLGLGYRDKGYFVDLTYAHAFGKDINIPYLLQDAQYPIAKNNYTNGQIVATVGFKF